METPTAKQRVAAVREMLIHADASNDQAIAIGHIILAVEALANVVENLAEQQDTNERMARRAADTASMLANGIIPD